MTGEPEIRAYVDATTAYYTALWTALPPSAATEAEAQHTENRQRFGNLQSAIDGYTGAIPPLTALPNGWTNLITGDATAQLATANALLTARNAARTVETAINADTEIRERIARAVRDDLKSRFLNTATGLATAPGAIGTISDGDKNAAVDFGMAVLRANTPTLTQAEATVILNDWIDTIATGSDPRRKADLATALGVAENALEAFDVTNPAHFQKAIDAFRNARGITTETGAFSPQSTITIRALRREELDRTLEARRAIDGIGQWSQETFASVSGWINGISNPPAAGAAAPTPTTTTSNNPLQGFMDWIGGIFGGGNGEGLNMGSIGGGVLGALGALLLGNVFPPALSWLSWLLVPMAVIMGANMGKNFGRDGDDAPDAGANPTSAPRSIEADRSMAELLARTPVPTTAAAQSLAVVEVDPAAHREPLAIRFGDTGLGAVGLRN
jgi:hypothetical protein